jgi:undecaprenyl-diphosphatase
LSLWEGIVLGIVQGLTEFLPVSSSGHLVIAQSFIKGFHQEGVLFDVMVHLGTLLAVLFFLRYEIYTLAQSLLPRKWHPNPDTVDEGLISVGRRLVWLIIIGTIITGGIGILFKDYIHTVFESAEIAAIMLIITGCLLYFTDKVKKVERTEGDMNITDAIVIGLAQAVALMPGISRSGTTIAFGIFRKINGETAARFSFLLSIPAIVGATVLELGYVQSIPPGEMIVYTAGMASAAVTGFFALKLLFFMIKKRELRIFAYYCWIIAITTLIVKAF